MGMLHGFHSVCIVGMLNLICCQPKTKPFLATSQSPLPRPIMHHYPGGHHLFQRLLQCMALESQRVACGRAHSTTKTYTETSTQA